MSRLEVTSELYGENDYSCATKANIEKNQVSRFYFTYPATKRDSDGDLIIQRGPRSKNYIEIEHSTSTVIDLVGFQIWRGALLLADFLIHLHEQGLLTNQTVLELGSGVGLTGIVACMFCNVICTDISNILDLIRGNFERNKTLLSHHYDVLELDFTKDELCIDVARRLRDVTIIIAADVIYDNDLTDHFVQILEMLLKKNPQKSIYVALEKRYVFTICDLESVAPMYEHFQIKLAEMLAKNGSRWTVVQMDLNFPKHFEYERTKHLVLLKIE